MKNIISALIIVFCFAANATSQSLWNEGLDGSFDNWEEVNEVLLPKGWYGNTYSGLHTYLTPTTDRHGNENKACKISTNFTAAVDHWYTWHLAAGTSSSNVLNIPKDTEFYYTFWAKAEVEGLKMYIGAPQMYDKNHGGNGTDRWDDMPYVELTTEWKQYGVLQKSNFDCTSFSIQLRGNKVFYVDDIVLEVGNEFPPLNQEEPELGPEPTSLWNEGLDGNFEEWEEAGGVLNPKGWYGTTYSDIRVGVEPTADRYGEENKACKINCSAAISWHTWHWAFRTVAAPGWGTLNVLNIPENTEFYYTFWAKASEADTRIYIGVEECYNPDWAAMPYVDLTTEWKQYAILQPACEKVGKTFSIHLRQGTQNKDIYIDDIVLNKGNKIPSIINGIATIPVSEIENWEENSLIDIHGVILTGSYGAEQFDLLKAALGTNQQITSIVIGETSLSAFDTDYFSAINPNCLKYVPEGATTTLTNYICGTTAISEIVLTDKKIFDCGEGITTGTAGISYSRSFLNNGDWETILLPFAPDAQGFGKFATYIVEAYVKTEDNVVKFSSVEELSEWVANRPYVLKAKEASQEEVYTISNRSAGIEIKTAPESKEFTGVYKPMEDETVYLLNPQGDAFARNSSGSVVEPFRAYYQPASGNPDSFAVEHEIKGNSIENIQTVTSVYSVGNILYISVTEPQAVSIYGIDGRKVRDMTLQSGVNQIENLLNGVYIVNKQKVVIK